MNPPDLRALQRGDPEASDGAFRWLWPVAFAVAELKLKPFLPGDVEDVAIETLEEIVDKVCEVERVEELAETFGLGLDRGTGHQQQHEQEDDRRGAPRQQRSAAAVHLPRSGAVGHQGYQLRQRER